MGRPIIRITCSTLKNDSFAYDRGIAAKGQNFQLLADDYVVSVLRAGGIPVLLPIADHAQAPLGLLDRIDGLLLSGGFLMFSRMRVRSATSSGVRSLMCRLKRRAGLASIAG